MNKRYKITIEEAVVETVSKGREWKEGVKAEAAGETGYGYTPQVEEQKTVERTIYSQDTDELDLVKVIKAINGIN